VGRWRRSSCGGCGSGLAGDKEEETIMSYSGGFGTVGTASAETEAIKQWQRIVGSVADGDFGPKTHNSTRAWQSAHGITPDGVVGPATWAAAGVRSDQVLCYVVGGECYGNKDVPGSPGSSAPVTGGSPGASAPVTGGSSGPVTDGSPGSPPVKLAKMFDRPETLWIAGGLAVLVAGAVVLTATKKKRAPAPASR
jgi:peptidoglycan hydrolase-like protein with peptidoglycan-binding domain